MKILLKNANSCYFIKHVIPDIVTVNPREGEALPPAKGYFVVVVVVVFPHFYAKNQFSLCGNLPPCFRERFADLSISQMAEH